MTPTEFASSQWDEVARKARDTEVGFGMWAGDEQRNRFLRSHTVPHLKQRYGITLRILPFGDTAEAVNKLLTEKGAGKTAGGSMDLLWINGENFRTARQAGVLWGPFAERLPNIGLYDDEGRKRDFGTPIEGMEAPWNRSQFVLAYDTARVATPPDSLEALRNWIKTHPGRFTYVAPPEFTGSAFVRHVLVHAGDRDARFWSGFDETLYTRAAAGAVAYLNDIKPFLWRRGETYPPTAKELDRLFANNDVDFAMSYGPDFASARIARGEFPPTARTFLLREGTIGNHGFLAVPFNASNPAGAVVTINELMSFEHMAKFTRAVQQLYPHGLDRLIPEQRAIVESLPRGPATLPPSELAAHLLPEPDAEYLARFEKDWLEKVLRQ